MIIRSLWARSQHPRVPESFARCCVGATSDGMLAMLAPDEATDHDLVLGAWDQTGRDSLVDPDKPTAATILLFTHKVYYESWCIVVFFLLFSRRLRFVDLGYHTVDDINPALP